MNGYGSPSEFPLFPGTEFDHGYGSPSEFNISGGLVATPGDDWGYGSPTPAELQTGTVVYPRPVGHGDNGVGQVGYDWDGVNPVDFGVSGIGSVDSDGDGVVRTRRPVTLVTRAGGEVVVVRAAWTFAGPYRVRLVSRTGALYPSEAYGCFAPPDLGDAFQPVAPPQPWWVVATRAPQGVGQYVTFVTPRCPPGLYDVRLDWIGGSLVVPEALRVVERRFVPETWDLRRLMPSVLKTGPDTSSAERLSYETEKG